MSSRAGSQNKEENEEQAGREADSQRRPKATTKKPSQNRPHFPGLVGDIQSHASQLMGERVKEAEEEDESSEEDSQDLPAMPPAENRKHSVSSEDYGDDDEPPAKKQKGEILQNGPRRSLGFYFPRSLYRRR